MKDKSKRLTETIQATRKAFKQTYGVSSEEINYRKCYHFAQEVIYAMGGETCFLFQKWLNHPALQYTTHNVIVFKGRYYDSECEYGVDDYLDLPFFQRLTEETKC